MEVHWIEIKQFYVLDVMRSGFSHHIGLAYINRLPDVAQNYVRIT